MKTPVAAPKKPPFRKLQGYAFDPSLSLRMDTAPINSIIYKVPWEEKLDPGPSGEYLEIIDTDPSSGKFYEPIDLNNAHLLAQDGLEPAESNPQFHQQMVYAVAMTTIKNFENALGRKIMWAPRRVADYSKYEEYVGQLRIYPHALREPNAYYSPEKKAILFGYFESMPADITLHMPESFVFTCLSHDIIAHEVTHAILDGIYPRYADATNPDVLAFHEAFADIVALFQHFTFPEVLKHQIAQTRGDLAAQNELGKLAQQFGTAIGCYGSLREAIGGIDPETKKWVPKEPTGKEYLTIMEPHMRGSILVSAVFEAFITIYKSRVKDLLRIASGGTGELPKGELHPDLVNRLATEASKAASHVLSMCIRALDYCPPVDITFGDYLRAIITADTDLITDDNRDYRIAFIEAFRRRGIYPQGLKTLGMETLKYKENNFTSKEMKELFKIIVKFLKDYRDEAIYETDRAKLFEISKKYLGGSPDEKKPLLGLHGRIKVKFTNSREFEQLTGLVLNNQWASLGVRTSKTYNQGKWTGPSFQVHNLRTVFRVGPKGNQINQIVFCIIQRTGIKIKKGKMAGHFQPDTRDRPANEFEMYGGCTMIFDLDTLELKYVVNKPLLDANLLKRGRKKIDANRAEQQYRYQQVDGPRYMSLFSQYFGQGLTNTFHEPFSFLHHR